MPTCNCCPNVIQYIRQHLDPDGLIGPEDDAAETLATFQGCFPGEDLGITVDDVADYIEEIRETLNA